MQLSYSCIYGLRASVLLAERQGDGFVTIQELSNELDISFYYLTKVLQHLTQAQILESYKGPNGGVRLAKNTEDITIQEIFKSLDKDYAIPECAIGLPISKNHKACPVYKEWTEIRIKIENLVETITIRELTKRE